MIRLKNGGVVREVETQREAEFYQKLGYKIESQDAPAAAPEEADGAAGKKAGGSGK